MAWEGDENLRNPLAVQMKLPRSMRMRRHSEFLRVRQKGKSLAGRFLVLACLRDEGVRDFKFGFVTSRGVGNAVARNRIRRRLRAIVQREGESLGKGHYLVMIARKGAAEASFDDLADDWSALGCRLGLRGR